MVNISNELTEMKDILTRAQSEFLEGIATLMNGDLRHLHFAKDTLDRANPNLFANFLPLDAIGELRKKLNEKIPQISGEELQEIEALTAEINPLLLKEMPKIRELGIKVNDAINQTGASMQTDAKLRRKLDGFSSSLRTNYNDLLASLEIIRLINFPNRIMEIIGYQIKNFDSSAWLVYTKDRKQHFGSASWKIYKEPSSILYYIKNVIYESVKARVKEIEFHAPFRTHSD